MANVQTITLVFVKLWKNPKTYALQGTDESGAKFRATFFPDTNQGQLLRQVQALNEGDKIEAGYTVSLHYKNLVSVKLLEQGPGSSNASTGGGKSSGGGRRGEFRTPAQMLKVSAMNIAAQLVHDYLEVAPKSRIPKNSQAYTEQVLRIYTRINAILQPPTADQTVPPTADQTALDQEPPAAAQPDSSPAQESSAGADAAGAATAEDDDIPF